MRVTVNNLLNMKGGCLTPWGGMDDVLLLKELILLFVQFESVLKQMNSKKSKNREILATSAAGVVSRKGLTESGTKWDCIMIIRGEEIDNIVIAFAYCLHVIFSSTMYPFYAISCVEST